MILRYPRVVHSCRGRIRTPQVRYVMYGVPGTRPGRWGDEGGGPSGRILDPLGHRPGRLREGPNPAGRGDRECEEGEVIRSAGLRSEWNIGWARRSGPFGSIGRSGGNRDWREFSASQGKVGTWRAGRRAHVGMGIGRNWNRLTRPTLGLAGPRRRRGGWGRSHGRQLAHGPNLDLADPFPGHADAAADLLECQRSSVQETESQRDDQALTLVQPVQSPENLGSILADLNGGLGRLTVIHRLIERPRNVLVAEVALQLELAGAAGLGNQALLVLGQTQMRGDLVEAWGTTALAEKQPLGPAPLGQQPEHVGWQPDRG